MAQAQLLPVPDGQQMSLSTLRSTPEGHLSARCPSWPSKDLTRACESEKGARQETLYLLSS